MGAVKLDKLSVERMNTLHDCIKPLVRRFLEICAEAGIVLRITAAFRTPEEQNVLFSIGRTTKLDSPTVTDARAWQSYHNYGLAIDVVPLVDGKPVWNNQELWNTIGKIGEELGFEWANRWRRRRELPHFQMTFGYTIKQLRALPQKDGKPILNIAA